MIALFLRAILLLLASWCLLPGAARAIPAFARRYETSCQTCHVAYPKLTPFGEAFRQNAYRFPEGGDEAALKQEPVALGNEAQKERWPAVVFPGEIPAQFPLSLVMSGTAGYGTAFEAHAHGAEGHGHEAEEQSSGHSHEADLQFGTLLDMFGLRAAAPLGEHVAVLAAVNLGPGTSVEVERANLILSPFARPTDLRIKVGAFEPELHGISIHRGLVGHMLRLTTATVGDSGWAPEPTQLGLELSGVALHRLGWAAGAVENATADVFMAKDAYGRLYYKLGGMPVDGSGGLSSTAAWRERSLTLGASVYNGRERISTETTAQDDPFTRVGVDGHAVFEDLALDLVLARQWDDSPWAGDSTAGITDRVYGELSWVALPVIFPTLRVEAARTAAGDEAFGEPDWLGMAALNGVIRPNVLLRAQAAVGAEPGGHTDFRFVTLSWSTAL